MKTVFPQVEVPKSRNEMSRRTKNVAELYLKPVTSQRLLQCQLGRQHLHHRLGTILNRDILVSFCGINNNYIVFK